MLDMETTELDQAIHEERRLHNLLLKSLLPKDDTNERDCILEVRAEYLLMIEDYAVGNLVKRANAYLNEVALKSLAGAFTILHMSESFLPMAEKVKLVNRCIDAIAFIACKESQFSVSSKADGSNEGTISSAVYHPKLVVDWWAKDLIVLRINMLQRVMIAMMAKGFKLLDDIG
ncbi:BTB/POZ domain-containing protein SR1IP1-like [Pyrus communis]|uniref:BTB/POZ domain-containing protein SR1IP1-like n=1 Tax=Pyrus communis TaxID=23211 RepID=UPI0035BF7553